MGFIDDATRGIREQAAKGAREAVVPWLAISIVLSLYAISRSKRR